MAHGGVAHDQTALNIMTVLALGGVVGSWLVGVIDEKIGTKKTMIGFGVWYCIALLLGITWRPCGRPSSPGYTCARR